MMKHEFEALALRNNATIGPELYNIVEHFYTSENDYHRTHGGIYETKYEFVERVFGGKVNTPKTICQKIIREAINENRYALLGCNVSEERLREMDKVISDHYTFILRKLW